MIINEMTTLASIGEMPALPMGLRYPRGLFGKARRSKRLHFRKLSKLKETTMRYIVIPDFLARLEEASLEEAKFEKGLRGKVKKALRAKRKADAAEINSKDQPAFNDRISRLNKVVLPEVA